MSGKTDKTLFLWKWVFVFSEIKSRPKGVSFRTGFTEFSKHLFRKVGQSGPYAFLEHDASAVWPALELVHDMGQSRARFREIRRVDLGQVAEQD